MWRSRKTHLTLSHSHRPASALSLGIGSFLNEEFALRRELLLLLSTYVILSLIKLFPTVKPSRAPSPTRLANMLPGLATIRKEGKANHRDHFTRAELKEE
uniref:hypothetical protein n=1 Tax=Jatropha curcas TaxID=180498 RepID=UPI0027A357B4|nr:hypothetical protein QLP06_mgp037 [Jatropha curcas]WFG81202.1 hypothetical protein [Jatropha curcas]